MIRGAYTPSLRVQTAPFGRCWYNTFILVWLWLRCWAFHLVVSGCLFQTCLNFASKTPWKLSAWLNSEWNMYKTQIKISCCHPFFWSMGENLCEISAYKRWICICMEHSLQTVDQGSKLYSTFCWPIFLEINVVVVVVFFWRSMSNNNTK